MPTQQQVIEETRNAERGYAQRAFTGREVIDIGGRLYDIVSLWSDGSIRELDRRWGGADSGDLSDYQSHVLTCPECAPIYSHVVGGVEPVFLPHDDYYQVISDEYVEVVDTSAAAGARRRAHRGSKVFP